MPATDSVVLKDLVADSLHTDFMRRYFVAFEEDLASKSSTGKSEWEDPERARKALIQTLKTSYNYYVHPEMNALVTAAMETMPEDAPVTVQDFPTQQGWLWLPQGMVVIDIRGQMVPTSAFAWDLHGGKVVITFFVDRQHRMDPLRHADYYTDPEMPRLTPWAMQTLQIDQPIPFVVSLGVVLPPEVANTIEYTTVGDKTAMFVPKGYAPEDLEVRERPDQCAAWLVACLRLMQQPLVTVTDQGLPANLRRGLKGRVRFKQTKISVIEYRRREGYMHDPDARREYSHAFLRRGHWRRVWFKTEDGDKQQRPVWIHPSIVNGGKGLPLLVRDHVSALIR